MPGHIRRDNIQGITKPSIKRLARKGGVKRLSGLCYEEIRYIVKKIIEQIIRSALIKTEHDRRKTVSTADIAFGISQFYEVPLVTLSDRWC
jgi:histone H4